MDNRSDLWTNGDGQLVCSSHHDHVLSISRGRHEPSASQVCRAFQDIQTGGPMAHATGLGGDASKALVLTKGYKVGEGKAFKGSCDCAS